MTQVCINKKGALLGALKKVLRKLIKEVNVELRHALL